MSIKRRFAICYRVQLVVTSVMGLSWLIWYLATDNIPPVSPLTILFHFRPGLPDIHVAASRWWDFPLTWLWVVIFTTLITRRREDVFVLAYIITAGLAVFGLVFGQVNVFLMVFVLLVQYIMPTALIVGIAWLVYKASKPLWTLGPRALSWLTAQGVNGS